MADTIREFLVGLGWQLDESGERRFIAAIEGATLRANLLADAVENMARVVVDKVAQVADQFEGLYYQSQRIGASAQSITAFGYAVSQLGGTVDSANASLQGFGDYLRNYPQAAGALAKQLGIPLKDTADKGLFLLEVYEELSKRPKYLADRFRQEFHLGDEATMLAAMRPGARDFYKKSLGDQENAGIGAKTTDEAKRLMQSWRTFVEQTDQYYIQAESSLFKHTANMLDQVNKYIDGHKSKISEFVDWVTTLGFFSEASGKTSLHFDEKKFGEHFEKALSAAETATVTQLKHLDDALHPVVEWFERFGRVLSGWFTQPHLNPDGTPEMLGGDGGFGGGGSWWSRHAPRWLGGGGAPPGVRARGTGVSPPGPPGTYRPGYNLSEKDLSDEVVKTINGEASTRNPAAIDAVINNMFNRLGAHGYGPSGNLEEVARSQGENGRQPQYTGYTPPSATQAKLIRDRIRAIASGGIQDNTHGSMEYRGAWLYDAFRLRHPEGVGVGGNWFFPTNAQAGPYAAFPTPHETRPSRPVTPTPTKLHFGGGQPLSWDQGPAWNNLNASLPVGGSTTNDNSKAITSSVTNNVTVNAPDPHSAAAMVGLHLDRSANDLARNLQGAHQ